MVWGKAAQWPHRKKKEKEEKEEVSLLYFFQKFKALLRHNNRALELMADMGEKLSGDYLFDRQYIESVVRELGEEVGKVIYNLNLMAPKDFAELFDAFEKAEEEVQAELDLGFAIPRGEDIYFLSALDEEMSDHVGNKMATLAQLRNRLGLPVPDGFVISTQAYKKFMEANELGGLLDSFAQAIRLPEDGPNLERRCQELQERILSGEVPLEIQKGIRQALLRISKESETIGWALRSSAAGEDGLCSHAGQYQTLLNVPASHILGGYKQVVASLFSPAVMAYRQAKPACQGNIAMAVGCLPMISARVSGVLYTADPTGKGWEQVLISSCWGLGKLVVEGEREVDRFTVSKNAPYPLLGQKIAKKSKQYLPAEPEGICLKPVSPEKQQEPSLNPISIRQLVEMALEIERYLKSFQDIEWSINAQGQIFLLQARPLQMSKDWMPIRGLLAAKARRYPILLQGTGAVASRGIGAGKVFVVHSAEEAKNFPRGAVLVLKNTSPRMSTLVPMASAIVTDIGTATGHMATICREFRVPTIVDTREATGVLQTGMEVTVDAEENTIYQGIVKELLTAQLIEKMPYEETQEFRLLRRLLKRVSTLHLTDPQTEDFSASRCLTYHDIIRFAHEMAVRTIATGIQPHRLGPKLPSKRVNLPIPLNLTLVDLGGAVVDPSLSSLSLEQISCTPLRVLLEALTAPGVWQSLPADMDLKAFFSSLTNFPGDPLSADSARVNIAVASQPYMSLNLWLGYHYNTIDTYMVEERNSNYIFFRFLGGVTENTRRFRRAKLLASILERNDFNVEFKGDLVIGRIKAIGWSAMEEKLTLLGRLIGFTRQLDVMLRDEGDIDLYADQFFQKGIRVEDSSSGSP